MNVHQMDRNTGTARTARLLRKAHLDNPSLVTPLPKSVYTDVESSRSEDIDAARALLAQHRREEPTYRAPETQKRNLFRSKSTRKLASDEVFWKFSKHEVACTFDKVLFREPPITVGAAKAILAHATGSSIEELWYHFHNWKTEKKWKSKLRAPQTSKIPDMTWLDHVTRWKDAKFVHMLCQAGSVSQSVLDSAFAVALKRHSMDIMKALLVWGANASACQSEIRDQFADGDLELAKLLLSAPQEAMSISAWRHSLAVVAANTEHSLLLLTCLANRPGIACASFLLDALEAKSLNSVTAILAYMNPQSWPTGVCYKVFDLVSVVSGAALRYDLLSLLYESRLLTDSKATQAGLMSSVKFRHSQIVQLMVTSTLR